MWPNMEVRHVDDGAIREALIAQFREGRDLDDTHEIYHDDAILEFPQSGERFVGKASFLAFRKRYPAATERAWAPRAAA
jgi:hypothetical protein